MTTHVRRVSAGAVSVIAVLLVAAAAAWACSPAASVDYCGSPSEGPAGSRVAVCLQGFEAGRPVQVRWGTTDGPVLQTATAQAAGSAIVVPVPANATVGRHMLVFAFRYSEGAGDVGSTRELAFTVLPSTAQQPVPPAPPVATETNGTSSGAEADAAFPAPIVPTSSGPVATVTEAAPLPAEQSLPVSANPGAVRQAGRAVFGGSVAPEAPTVAAGDDGEIPAVPARTASGDLWSGFASGTDRPAFGLGQDSRSSSGSSGGLALVLVGAGMMALFAGFGITELGRRRALARAGDR